MHTGGEPLRVITDGLPALARATDPIDPDVLTRPPRRPEAQLVDRAFFRRVALVGGLSASAALSAFAYEWYSGNALARARSAAPTGTGEGNRTLFTP